MNCLKHRNKMRIEASSWRGPLPPPSALQSYEEVLEGSADRILKMAEKQTEHRILYGKHDT